MMPFLLIVPVREGGRHDLLDAAIVRREHGAPEGDERRVDVRLRSEDRTGNRVEPGSLGGELDAPTGEIQGSHDHRPVSAYTRF